MEGACAGGVGPEGRINITVVEAGERTVPGAGAHRMQGVAHRT